MRTRSAFGSEVTRRTRRYIGTLPPNRLRTPNAFAPEGLPVAVARFEEAVGEEAERVSAQAYAWFSRFFGGSGWTCSRIGRSAGRDAGPGRERGLGRPNWVGRWARRTDIVRPDGDYIGTLPPNAFAPDSGIH